MSRLWCWLWQVDTSTQLWDPKRQRSPSQTGTCFQHPFWFLTAGLTVKSAVGILTCGGICKMRQRWARKSEWRNNELGSCDAGSLEDVRFRTERGNHSAAGTHESLVFIRDPRKETTQRTLVMVGHFHLQPTRLQHHSPKLNKIDFSYLWRVENQAENAFSYAKSFSAIHVVLLQIWDLL